MQAITPSFIVYKSSAGSGKTYTLTMEYLKLALVHPGAFRQILAVTFTNKATTEMKERILKELRRMTKSINPEEKMDAEILGFLQVDELELKKMAKSTLTSMLHDYAAFSVSTIDSFFQKVIRAFAREIDLQAKFEVEMDQEGVMNRMVDRLLEQVTADEHLHRWLVNYAVERIREGKTWDIRMAISELGRELFRESFKTHKLEIKQFLNDKENLHRLTEYISKQRKALLAQAQLIKSKANEIRVRHGLEWTDFKGGKNGFARKFDELGNNRNLLPDLTDKQKEDKDDLDFWLAKTSAKREQVQAAFEEGLGVLWNQMLTLYKPHYTVEAIRKNLYVYGVFKQLIEALDTIKEEENIMLISDANDFLKSITANNEAPFIYEKVGNRYHHYLIDEFQDTSGFQWESFRPLLVNALAQGKTNLLVGDVKQSIYRWRGGELRLLLDQVEQEVGHFGMAINQLDTNFRSLANIVNFNNALFERLSRQMAQHLEDELNSGGILEQAYEEVAQKVSPQKENLTFKGKVRLEFLENEENEESLNEMILKRLPEMVMYLQALGYRPKDIAFLVRKNAEGQKIAESLLQYGLAHPESPYSFDVLSEEALLIKQAEKVKCLVAALKYLKDANPSRQKTLWLHYAKVEGVEVSHEIFDPSPSGFVSGKPSGFEQKKGAWLKLPIMEMVNELAEWLGFHGNGRERAYLAAFKEAVMDFSSIHRADLQGFLDWWEEKQHKLTVRISEGHDAIRILTIHKSKGLQFKVVVMPFLDWKIFDASKSTVVWAPFDLPEEGINTVVPLSISSKLKESLFSPIYNEEMIMAYLDTLNMAYVAFTRAEEIFWGLSPWKDIQKNNSGTLGINLLKALCSGASKAIDLTVHYDEEQKIFDFGAWPEKREREKVDPYSPLMRWAQQSWQEKLTVKTTTLHLLDQVGEREERIRFGQQVHGILEKAKNERDVQMRLDELYFEGVLQETEKQHIASQMKELFKLKDFKQWFSGEAKILREQGILIPDGQQKRPDRVVIFKDHAEVVDFKTGAKQAWHQNQVRSYMELVGPLVGLPVKGYVCYLDPVIIEEVN